MVPADTAAELVRSLPVFDAHVDSLQRQLDLAHDLGTRTSGHLDLVRGRAGGLGAVVLVNWVDPKFIPAELGGARKRTLELLREFHVLLARHPDQIAWAGNGERLRAIRAGGLIAGIPGIEGGHSIEEDLDHLHEFFVLGVRVLTLVWNNHLPWIRSCQAGAGAHVPEGIDAFGRSVVETMNDLGMLIDVSHAGERAFYDILDTTREPVIASHSACKALHGHQRNLTDEQLRALADNDGVVGIVFCPAFLKDEAQADEAQVRETPEFKAIAGTNDTDVFLKQGEFMQRAAKPLSMEVVLDHVCHAADVAGVGHVGIGSDYDGIGRTPAGLEDATCYTRLSAGLLERGFSREEAAAVLGGNMARVFARVTRVGTRASWQELAPFVPPGCARAGMR